MYDSDFYCDTEYPWLNTYLTLSNNSAVSSGGAIYAIRSSIKVGEPRIDIFSSTIFVNIVSNQARKGGGICFEANTKLILYLESASVIAFERNSAEYGGAIFVVDDTYSGACLNSSYEEYTECFLSVLQRNETLSDVSPTYSFTGNTALTSGHNLYGGLLDRCSRPKVITPIGTITSNVVFFFQNMSNVGIDTISSDPLRLCVCSLDGEPDCFSQPSPVRVKKGYTFNVSLVAVDEVLHKKSYVPIHGYLSSVMSSLATGELTQITTDVCSTLSYTIYSTHSSEMLTLYASGPCKDATPSQQRVIINFSSCECPIGFQEVETNTTCECVCDVRLLPYIFECDASSEELTREGDFWISNISVDEYLIYPHCLLDYCTRSNVKVHLNTPNGPDTQCINNRHGKLCGACKRTFSLSLGTSSCIACPSYWPALLVGMIMLSGLAGIGLTALLLELNLTVAVGTLNGLIFYANIIDANRSTFFSSSNFVTMLIAWLNLELGFDLCFFQGMDSYWKTWLQLAFPTYVIILVIIVIFASERHTKFARIIGRKNPVATLNTLILLSYTKILRTVIATLSFSIADDSKEIVWLTDAHISYLGGKHIPLFLVAILILLVGTVYTALLFSWQWLLLHQNKMLFKWVRYQQLNLFLEPYLAPYTAKHHYWTGLLLLLRVILYLFTVSVSTVVREPDRWNLLIIIVATLGILLPKIIFGIKLYQKMAIDTLESISYLNLLMFCVAKLFIKIEENEQKIIAYVSGTIFFLLLLFVIIYHFFTEFISKTTLWHKVNTKRVADPLVEIDFDVHNNEESSHIQVSPTSTVVDRPTHRDSLSNIEETSSGSTEMIRLDKISKPADAAPLMAHHDLQSSAVPYQLLNIH